MIENNFNNTYGVEMRAGELLVGNDNGVYWFNKRGHVYKAKGINQEVTIITNLNNNFININLETLGTPSCTDTFRNELQNINEEINNSNIFGPLFDVNEINTSSLPSLTNENTTIQPLL